MECWHKNYLWMPKKLMGVQCDSKYPLLYCTQNGRVLRSVWLVYLLVLINGKYLLQLNERWLQIDNDDVMSCLQFVELISELAHIQRERAMVLVLNFTKFVFRFPSGFSCTFILLVTFSDYCEKVLQLNININARFFWKYLYNGLLIRKLCFLHFVWKHMHIISTLFKQ